MSRWSPAPFFSFVFSNLKEDAASSLRILPFFLFHFSNAANTGNLRGPHCQGALLISSLPPGQTAWLSLTPVLLVLKDRRVRILESLLLLNPLQLLRHFVTMLSGFFLHPMTR